MFCLAYSSAYGIEMICARHRDVVGAHDEAELRTLIIVALWLGAGFAITEFVASTLEKSRANEHQTVEKLTDPARDARDISTAGVASH